MTITDEAIDAAIEIDMDAVMSNKPSCDLGGILYLRSAPDNRCGRSAEWTALTHDCHIGTPIILCTPHLVQLRADPAPRELISWICDDCELIATSVDEYIWNIKRLGAAK